MPILLVGCGFRNLSGMSPNSTLAYSCGSTIKLFLPHHILFWSFLKIYTWAYLWIPTDWSQVISSKTEQTHRGTKSTVASANRNLAQSLRLSWLKVLVFRTRAPGEQKGLEIAAFNQYSPKTTPDIKKKSYEQFGIIPPLNNLNFLFHLEYYIPTVFNEWNFLKAVTACLSAF